MRTRLTGAGLGFRLKERRKTPQKFQAFALLTVTFGRMMCLKV